MTWIYALFCDMVHPNIGSTFLVASSGNNEIHFVKGRGTPIGRALLEQTLPFLLAVGVRPSMDYLAALITTTFAGD